MPVALEEAYREGKLRAIGVSNFYPDHLIDLASNVDVKPMVNQVETHVFDQQVEGQKYMDELDCRIMSWGPLAEGRNGFFTNELVLRKLRNSLRLYGWLNCIVVIFSCF